MAKHFHSQVAARGRQEQPHLTNTASDNESDASLIIFSDSDDEKSTSRKRKRQHLDFSDSDTTVDCNSFTIAVSDSEDDPSTSCSLFKNTKRINKEHTISDSDSDSPSHSHCAPNQKKSKSKSESIKLRKDNTSRLDDSSCRDSKAPDSVKSDDRPFCRFGSKCYRKNPLHFEKYQHPGKVESSSPNKHNSYESSSVSNTKNVYAQHALSNNEGQQSVNRSPLGFMLTKVFGIEDKYNQHNAMDIKDILSPIMGKLVKSLQFNYSIDIKWLVEQYPKPFRANPLLVVHGCQRAEKKALEDQASLFDHVHLCQARLDIPYGTHHTKMMILLYEEGLRIVIHTANLVQGDWHQKTQGIWMSEVFPRISPGSKTCGDSATHFKRDLIQYITAYKAPLLNEWIKILELHDLSTAKVYLIGSVPGRHTGENKSAFGHLKLRKILQVYGPSKLHVQNWPVIGQFSSIGSLGASKETWVYGEWLESLSAAKNTKDTLWRQNTKLHLIFPSKENVRLSLEGYLAGGSLPYSINVAKKQPWLHEIFCQWKADICGRSHASPHIKTYMRISPDWQNIAWFLVTSANLSKAAWGTLEKNGSQLMIRSYELGVLFLPEHFNKSQSFYRQKSLDECSSYLDTKQVVFCLPYDMPPTPYSKEDRPWIWDIPYVDKPDTNGNKWCPS